MSMICTEKIHDNLSERLKSCLPPDVCQAAMTVWEIYNKLNQGNEKDFYGFVVEFLLKDYLSEYVYVLRSMDSLSGGILDEEDIRKLEALTSHANPFYSEKNQTALRKAMDDYSKGRNFNEHELIEELIEE